MQARLPHSITAFAANGLSVCSRSLAYWEHALKSEQVLRDVLARWKEKGDKVGNSPSGAPSHLTKLKVLLFSRSTRLLDALEYWLEMGERSHRVQLAES